MEPQICDSEWRRRLLESELSYWDRKSPSERQLWLENVSLRKFRKLIAREMSLLLENKNLSEKTHEPLSKDELSFLADAARHRIKERQKR